MTYNYVKSLGDRMKEYENVTNTEMYKRTPIILRVDGRAFHTFTRGLDHPYDKRFMNLMDKTMIAIVSSLPDVVISYVQSDEISIAMCPYKTFATEPVFSGRVQKLCSVVSSIATQAFIKALLDTEDFTNIEKQKYFNRNITFDCRCFNLPKEEVVNYFVWRQQDCKRNSILNAAHEYLGKKESFGFKTTELIDKMLKEKNIDYWAIIPKHVHYGRMELPLSNIKELILCEKDFSEFRDLLDDMIFNPGKYANNEENSNE